MVLAPPSEEGLSLQLNIQYAIWKFHPEIAIFQPSVFVHKGLSRSVYPMKEQGTQGGSKIKIYHWIKQVCSDAVIKVRGREVFFGLDGGENFGGTRDTDHWWWQVKRGWGRWNRSVDSRKLIIVMITSSKQMSQTRRAFNSWRCTFYPSPSTHTNTRHSVIMRNRYFVLASLLVIQ